MQSSIGSQKRLGRKRFKELGRRRRFRNQCSAAIGCTFLLGWAVIICYLFQRVSEGSKEHHAAAADAATIDSGGVPPVHRSSSSNPGDGTVNVDTLLLPQVHGHYAMLGSGPTQMEAVYSIPDKTTPKGIVLIFHACTHNALKFFVPNPTDCPQCIGLSEEIRITQLVNARGYAILALTSQDRQSGCWSADMPAVRAALTDFQTRVLLADSTNVIAIGASSGGNFAAAVAANGIARAALIMVMGLGPVVRGQLVENSTKAAMPLLYLAPMPRDQGTTKKARGNYEELAKSNASRIIFDDTTCVSLPVTATYLHQRVPNLPIEAAALIVEALTSSQHLNAETNMFVTDPTRSNWRDVLREACEAQGCLDQQSLEPGLSPLAKALHRAWAFHEYCSEVIPKAFDFFEKGQP